MARKSRKANVREQVYHVAVYIRTALYIRLSVEDNKSAEIPLIISSLFSMTISRTSRNSRSMILISTTAFPGPPSGAPLFSRCFRILRRVTLTA